MLKQRIITALILLPIALCGFFLLEGSGFALFIGLVVTLGAWEWARLAGFEAQSMRVGYAVVVAAMLFVMHLEQGLAPWVLGAAVLWWGVATFLVLMSVLLPYILLAAQARGLLKRPTALKALNRSAAAILAGTAAYIATRAA